MNYYGGGCYNPCYCIKIICCKPQIQERKCCCSKGWESVQNNGISYGYRGYNNGSWII